MFRMIFQTLEFIPSLDTAYAHLIPMPPRTETTSKQGNSLELVYISLQNITMSFLPSMKKHCHGKEAHRLFDSVSGVQGTVLHGIFHIPGSLMSTKEEEGEGAMPRTVH